MNNTEQRLPAGTRVSSDCQSQQGTVTSTDNGQSSNWIYVKWDEWPTENCEHWTDLNVVSLPSTEFPWSRCATCGSTLGGSRSRLAAF